MNIEEFWESAKQNKLSLGPMGEGAADSPLLSNEALFHLPLLAMFILMMAKGRKKPRIDELGQTVGECIERTLAGFKGSSQHIGWSGNLRVRTVNALAFLELADLVHVNQNTKFISTTQKGTSLYALASEGEGNLAITLKHAERLYGDMNRETQIRLKVL
ncbi:hypothetical protein MIZ01_1930 [Sideroxyarcus emersonii]|uniref:Uncharacterized protein n=1 Tax=Sideroxyarcus emersonii TaxID=2764705 RepID=A0AAN1XB95_9PROT|nr:hypothetical protein [Sideroxyarcus emersonii]BCK88129.1 hypothetical protein MIZ01_1930 [Sideroxyarcus emersonii]